MKLADLRALVEEHGKNPRVHPNGFIQLDIAPTEDGWHESHKRGHSGAERRLHIWNPPGIELPHQDTTNEIHDHVFDMHSEIIKGILWQVRYSLEVGGASGPDSHELYRAVYDKSSSSRLESTGVTGRLNKIGNYSVEAGLSYSQPAFTFHDTDTPRGLVVTVMEKTQIHDGDAHVLCRIGEPPDNSFDRASAMPAWDIWKAIWASLE